MARIRTIKPEFWVSEQISECSPNARLTFVGMWNFCDDRGVHPAKPKTLKAELYPMDDITASQVGMWVDELIRVGLVREFEDPVDHERYWHVTGWDRHQRIDRPSFKHPAPPPLDSTNPRRAGSSNCLDDESSNPRRAPPPGVEGNGKEGSGEEGSSPKARSKRSTSKPPKTPMPADFKVSPEVSTWAANQAYGDLDQHLESFKAKCAANGYRYADWDAAFKEAIRADWARVRDKGPGRSASPAKDIWAGCQ